MPAAIDPDAIPGKDLNPDAVEENARTIGTLAGAVRDNGSTVHLKWQGMASVYEAPEAGTLLGLMQPVSSQATQAGDNLDAVSAALSRFAADARPIKEALDQLRIDAQAFRAEIAGGVSVRELNPAYVSAQGYQGSWSAYGAASTTASDSDIPQHRTVTKQWHEVQSYVDRNNELISAVNVQQVALWDAERSCANKVRALYGAAPLHAFESQNDVNGYGLSEIPEGTEMPWGAPVERTESCGEAAVNFVVKDFLWEGVIVGGVWGTVQGLGTLVLGYNPATGDWFSGEAYGAAWSNLGLLAAGAVIATTPPLNLLSSIDDAVQQFGGDGILPGPVGDIDDKIDEAFLNTGKALIAWDKWADDPGTAAGESLFNVATALIPAGAAVAGVKTASVAASVLTKMARVVDLVDPAAWAVNGTLRVGSAGLGSLDGLIGRLDLPASSVDASHVEVYTAMDSASALRTLDDWGVDPNTVTARVDDGIPVLEAPGIRVELPAGAFDGIRAGDGGTDAAIPAPVREPELVAAGSIRGETGPGPGNSIVDDAPVRTETGGGSGESGVVRDPEPGGASGSSNGGDRGESNSSNHLASGDGELGGHGGDGGPADVPPHDPGRPWVADGDRIATYPDSLTVNDGNVVWIVGDETVGAVPIRDYVDIRGGSMHNMNADSLVLGKYTSDGNSYIDVAHRRDATYFDMGHEGWADVQRRYRLNDAQMFEFFNKPALDDAVADGKTIRFSHDPRDYNPSALYDEWDYLKNHHGFSYLKEDGDGWVAVS